MSITQPLPVVLVVEDDPLVRTLAVEVVEDAGFLAIEAANADEAIIILEHRADIALVFTDIDMPGSMDGLKLAHAIRNRWSMTCFDPALDRPVKLSAAKTDEFGRGLEIAQYLPLSAP